MSSLLLPLHDQPTQLGICSEHQINWSVGPGWKTEVLSIPEGTVVPLQIRVTTIDEGVLVEVDASVEMVGECVRCVTPVTLAQNFSAAEAYAYPDAEARRAPKSDQMIEIEGDDLDEVLVIDREQVDLEPILRDAILSEAPLQPICSKDCQGICVHCGVLLKDAEPGHQHQFKDPRFAVLEGYFGK